MKFLRFFIIFAAFYIIFSWIIKKTNIHNKLFGKPYNYKYKRTILILVLFLLAVLFEYGQELLNEKYGQHNIISIIIGAFLGSIYLNFIPVILRRNKQ